MQTRLHVQSTLPEQTSWQMLVTRPRNGDMAWPGLRGCSEWGSIEYATIIRMLPSFGCSSMPMGLDSLPSFLQESFPGSQKIMRLLRQSGFGLNDEGNGLQVNYFFFLVVACG